MNYIRYTVQRSGSSATSTTSPAASPVERAQSAINYQEYYNNFGDNKQNATNSADFFDGSNTGPFGLGVA